MDEKEYRSAVAGASCDRSLYQWNAGTELLPEPSGRCAVYRYTYADHGRMELLKKLNQNHVLPYTVVLSAYDDFSYARDCLKLGVSEFLLKSEITKDELEACLQTAKERIRNQGAAETKQSSPAREMEKVLLQCFKEPDYISRDILKQVWNTCCEIKGEVCSDHLPRYRSDIESGTA